MFAGRHPRALRVRDQRLRHHCRAPRLQPQRQFRSVQELLVDFAAPACRSGADRPARRSKARSNRRRKICSRPRATVSSTIRSKPISSLALVSALPTRFVSTLIRQCIADRGTGRAVSHDAAVRQHVEGRLVVDIFDVRTHQPAWHGWATKSLSTSGKKDPQTGDPRGTHRHLRQLPAELIRLNGLVGESGGGAPGGATRLPSWRGVPATRTAVRAARNRLSPVARRARRVRPADADAATGHRRSGMGCRESTAAPVR